MKRESATVQPTLTEQVMRQLLEYIRKYRLEGGEELPTETELMELLHVSRSALREALCHLKALGIVTSRRGSGVRVNEPELIDAMSEVIRHVSRSGRRGLHRLYEHRRFLELGCVGDAVERVTDEQLLQIERSRAAYEEAARAAVPFPAQLNLAEIEFHESLMAPASCKTLETISIALHELFENRTAEEQSFGGYSEEALSQIILEHRAIADAYRIHSPEAAYFALRRHLRWGSDAIL